MKVTRTGDARPVGGARRTQAKNGSGNFAGHLSEGTPASSAAAGVESSSNMAVDSLLSVQEVPDPTSERSRGLARAHGEDLLERLDSLRVGIISGAIPKEKLVELAQRLRAHRQRSDDARLNEILDEIELRAEVEIAKLTR